MRLVAATLVAVLCYAQDTGVSIRVHGAGGKGRFNFQDVTTSLLIQTAYAVRDFQIVGGPEWINSDRFDVLVPTDGLRINLQIVRPKVQALLKDRFKLQCHLDKKELPFYTLTVGKYGPRMWKTTPGSCIPFDPTVRHPPVVGAKPPDYCGFIRTGIDAWLNRTWDGIGVSMAGIDEMPGLVTLMSTNLHRMIIDKTGLTAKYDFHLEWDPSATPESEGHPDQAGEIPGPSLVKAVEDQLGLKLEAGKGPVRVLVIDHIEKPDLK